MTEEKVCQTCKHRRKFNRRSSCVSTAQETTINGNCATTALPERRAKVPTENQIDLTKCKVYIGTHYPAWKLLLIRIFKRFNKRALGMWHGRAREIHPFPGKESQ